jgi:hypothetical protein
MTRPPLTTPVALAIFNRVDTTERVFAAIREARPAQLLVIADGPRADRPGEAERCAATRAIVERVDWPCQVRTDFAVENLGCKRRISSGLDWVFSQVEEAIILEDDCVPSQSFFWFCQELLARYRHDPRVMSISGDNFIADRTRHASDSYHFSKYPQVWGWASWRRAWAHYDVTLRGWPKFARSPAFAEHCAGPRERRYWRRAFARTHAGRIDTWDYQWVHAIWANGGLSVMPSKNLVSNIGLTPGATHLVIEDEGIHNLPAEELWDLSHPARVEADRGADREFFRRVYAGRLRRVFGHLRRGLARGGVSGLTDATRQLAHMTWRTLRARG